MKFNLISSEKKTKITNTFQAWKCRLIEFHFSIKLFINCLPPKVQFAKVSRQPTIFRRIRETRVIVKCSDINIFDISMNENLLYSTPHGAARCTLLYRRQCTIFFLLSLQSSCNVNVQRSAFRTRVPVSVLGVFVCMCWKHEILISIWLDFALIMPSGYSLRSAFPKWKSLA